MKLQLLEENIGANLGDLVICNEFSSTSPNMWSMKEKCDKWDFIKIKNCSVNDTVKQVKIRPWIGRKYLENISDKGLVSKR